MADERTDITEYTPDEYATAVDEAHKLGRKIAVHASRQPALGMVIEAGVDTIEHGWYLTTEQVYRMKEKGIALTPTLFIHKAVMEGLRDKRDRTGFESFTKRDWNTWDRYGEYEVQLRDHMLELANTGVTLLTGTDMILPGYPVWPVAREVAVMVEYGIEPLRAIAAATRNSAEMLGIDAGEVAAGKLADLLVVEGDASADVAALEKVLAVFLGGELVP